jgi:glutamate 5-kinase
VDGVYTAHPDEEGAELIEVIENVNSELLSATSGGKTAYGRGGMDGKLRAARLATSAGIQATIANGEQADKIVAAVNDGAVYGTACKARLHEGVQLSNRDRWVMAAMQADGTIQIDPGATTAVQKRKSLLAVGVSRVYGTFEAGDAVEIVGADKETIAIGQTAIASSELDKLVSSDERPYDVEVVHADNLIMI